VGILTSILTSFYALIFFYRVCSWFLVVKQLIDQKRSEAIKLYLLYFLFNASKRILLFKKSLEAIFYPQLYAGMHRKKVSFIKKRTSLS